MSITFNEPIPKTQDGHTRFFLSKDHKVLITHSTSIDNDLEKALRNELATHIKIHWKSEARRLRPDIVIFKRIQDRYEPIAIIQVKIYPVTSNVIVDEVGDPSNPEKKGKFEKMDTGSSLMALIFFHKISPKYFKDIFVDRYPDRATVIIVKKENNSCVEEAFKIKFKELLERIKEKILE